MGRFGTAWRAFWSILGSDECARKWLRANDEAAVPETLPTAPRKIPEEPGTDSVPGDAVYTLVLLQREGRLVDFLMEDIDGFEDAQVGAAVRQIHANCGRVLEKHFGVHPIRTEGEGANVALEAGFDPRRIRLTGNAGGEPPFRGSLRHAGWEVAKVDFPRRHENLDPAVICPAEVEV